MVHDACQITVRKCNPSEGSSPHKFAGSRFAGKTEEEAGLRAQVRMAPAIENDTGDITARVESRLGKHLSELLANLAFIIAIGGGKECHTPALHLLRQGKTWLRVKDLQRQHSRRIWRERRRWRPKCGNLAHCGIVADSFEPLTLTYSQLREEAPV